jgi:heme/copper-type cytochrome/quinol oxidase subunit 3
MEIPYIVNPRKDTGLFNSKIAIWLFLASEVMLFGGFFSAYVFLRLGADYPWPERTLPVLPGLINTFVLIGSSVTVVFAWAALKMREWRKFQIFMGITVACAAIFMVLKAVEYNVKFNHQGVRLNDFTVIEGHLGYTKDGDRKVEQNRIFVEASQLTFSTVRYHRPWVEEVMGQAARQGAKIQLAEDVMAVTQRGGEPVVLAKAGTELSLELLKEIRSAHLDARSHNSSRRTAALRTEWREAKAAAPGEPDWKLAPNVNIDMAALSPQLLTEVSTLTFKVVPAARLEFKPRDVREGATSSRLRDDTVIEGPLLSSPMVLENVDAIDFQHLVMKAEARGVDPITAIENSWLYQNNEFVREVWAWHQEKIAKLEAELAPRGRVPTEKERYRIGWHEMTRFADTRSGPTLGALEKFGEEFMGPNYGARGVFTFPELEIPREQVGFAAKFSPAWNTYYAIYFTMTGLHGLHVIGGAIVLAYYLFFGRAMYLTNPEWLANRVEVGGLFWHFVDLVWIFVFPILYLM